MTSTNISHSTEVPTFGIVNRRAAFHSVLLFYGAVGVFVISVSRSESSTRHSTLAVVCLLVYIALYGLSYLPSWLKTWNAGRLHCRMGRHFSMKRLPFGWIALGGVTLGIQVVLIDVYMAIIVLWATAFAGIDIMASSYIRIYDKGFCCPTFGFVRWNDAEMRIRESGETSEITFGKVGIEPVLLTVRVPEDQLTEVHEIFKARRPARLVAA